ncbi:toprim domain-containing protein [Candidatus Bathyarchaeota archaeon]|nr:toprim domain-containing protein [Candidatus Bathyarchaeota archaeon]
MSTRLEKRTEKILKLLERLGKKSARGIPIIVEGKNDIIALRRLNVKGDIISAKTSGKSFLDVLREVEGTGKREIIILMDFDRRGREWTKRLMQHLEKMKIKPNSLFWRELLGLVGRDVKDIEGLASYMETLRKKCGG